MPLGSSKLVLAVVDDDHDVRRAMERLLLSCGYSVEVFDSAEAYLKMNCEPDCAILDIDLPGISGLELEERIRPLGTPVVFITAHDDLVTRAGPPQSGLPLFRKPLDEDGLLAAIVRATDEAM